MRKEYGKGLRLSLKPPLSCSSSAVVLCVGLQPPTSPSTCRIIKLEALSIPVVVLSIAFEVLTLSCCGSIFHCGANGQLLLFSSDSSVFHPPPYHLSPLTQASPLLCISPYDALALDLPPRSLSVPSGVSTLYPLPLISQVLQPPRRSSQFSILASSP